MHLHVRAMHGSVRCYSLPQNLHSYAADANVDDMMVASQSITRRTSPAAVKTTGAKTDDNAAMWQVRSEQWHSVTLFNRRFVSI